MNTQTCESCIHFHQHYIRHRRGSYAKTGSGHCDHPMIKLRRNTAKSCDNWKPNEHKK